MSLSQRHFERKRDVPATALARPLAYRQCPIRPFGAPSPKGKAVDTRIAASQKIFGHRLIYIRGEAATTTLNPEPMEPTEFLMPCIHGRAEPAAFISV